MSERRRDEPENQSGCFFRWILLIKINFEETVMKKLISIYALIFSANILFSSLVFAAVPPVERKGGQAVVICPTSATGATTPAKAYYSDKIVFMIVDKLISANTADQQALSALPLNTPLDVKLRDNPGAVADIKSKVLSFLGASVDANSGNAQKINVISVEYSAIVCPKSP